MFQTFRGEGTLTISNEGTLVVEERLPSSAISPMKRECSTTSEGI